MSHNTPTIRKHTHTLKCPTFPYFPSRIIVICLESMLPASTYTVSVMQGDCILGKSLNKEY